MAKDTDSHWHLDKRVPVALIVTILVQTGGFIFAMGVVWTKVDANERAIAQIEAKRDGDTKRFERLIRVESDVANMAATLKRIEQKLDNLK